MKQLATAILALTLLIPFSQPVWARTCPKLIKEGRDLLAKSKLVQKEKDKAKALLDESEKLHDGGDHGESMKKVKEALTLLKKK
jgi:hypothetical protein